MLRCLKGFSLDDEFYNAGSSGGVASTLGFIALKFKLCNGVIALDRTVSPPVWVVALSKDDLLKSCGSTYEDLKFDSYLCKSGFSVLGMIGKPCDMKLVFSPRISLFCSHTYRSKSFVISKKYSQSPKPKWKSIFSNPVKCFLCMDHLGYVADVNVGDDQVDPKLNNEALANDCVISRKDARVTVAVIPTNEELMIAQETLALVGLGGAGPATSSPA